MRARRNLLPLVLPLLVAGVAALGALLAQLPGRGVEAPLPGPVAQAEPGFADYFATGIHLLQVGLPREAAGAFQSASRLRPDVVEAQINLGFAYLATQDPAKAEAAFRIALDRKPGQINGYYGWAQSLEALGDLPAALGAMRTFVHLSREDDPYRTRALAAIWEWQSALERPQVEAPAEAQREPATREEAGHRLANVDLLRPDGTLTQLHALHPGKAIILNVWATWCPPCRGELPSLQRLSDSLDPERYVVIGLSVDQDADFVREYLRDVGITFANYVAADPMAAAARLEVESFPQTLMVRPDGTLAQRVVGARDWAAAAQRSTLQWLWSLGKSPMMEAKQGETP